MSKKPIVKWFSKPNEVWRYGLVPRRFGTVFVGGEEKSVKTEDGTFKFENRS